MSNPQPNTNVALLYQTQELGRHLRDALSSLGTSIVYEAATDHLDPGALEESGARVVIVNLDPAVEDHLDEVYNLLEDNRYSVVFNDAQVSSELSGWDQARWARHLAAKILGDVNIDPPRPEGAEAIPMPPPVTSAATEAEPPLAGTDADRESEADAAAMGEAFELSNEPEASYDTRLESIAATDAGEPEPEAEAASHADPLDLLESRYDEMNQPAESAFPSPPPPPADTFDFSTLEALTAPAPPTDAAPELTLADEFVDETPSEESEPQEIVPARDMSPETDEEEHAGTVDVDPDLAAFDLDALDKLFDAPDAPTVGEPAVEAVGESDIDAVGESEIDTVGETSIDVGDLGDEASDAGDTSDEERVTEEPVKVPDISGLSLLEESLDEAPAPAAKNEDASPLSALKLAAAADWSLEDMLEGGPPPEPDDRADFGIEKVSAAEYLAPAAEEGAPQAPVPESDFSFELMPMEEAVAPQQVQSEPHEAWLDPDKVVLPPKIRRVWVLGASIGGPEALREFLAEMPRDYPALFLLAQHMGAEFVDLMAQQLAKATQLTVRTPTHGERVGHGEVVIVPTTHRLRVDPQGIVVLERISGDESAYSPSIDRVLKDAADGYGANAAAIIFSGMTNDAIEGSTYLASKGGMVYAQHPDTCVVSSMVDGVVEAGVVKRLGTPKELAEVLIAQATQAAKPSKAKR